MERTNLSLDEAAAVLAEPDLRERLDWLVPGLIPPDEELGGPGARVDGEFLDSLARVLTLRRDFADVFLAVVRSYPASVESDAVPSLIDGAEEAMVMATVVSAAYLSLPRVVAWHGYTGQSATEVGQDYELLMQLSESVVARPGPCIFGPFSPDATANDDQRSTSS